MRRFFILGTHPGLSAAEITAVAGIDQKDIVWASPEILVAETGPKFDAAAVMSRLGGTIKIGRLLDAAPPPNDRAAWLESLTEELEHSSPADHRVTFGLSVYLLDPDLSRDRASKAADLYVGLGLAIKKELKERGRSARWVEPRPGRVLSSVAVAKNRLIEEGAEFVVLVRRDGQAEVGLTEVVQPFEEFSQADYGRPSRDTLQGMLPPKLARLMVNLARVPASAVLLDPFCGSGTVLTEALRLGFRKVVGSDIDPEAIKSTEKNIAWLKDNKLIAGDPETELLAADARDLIRRLPQSSVEALVSEVYLGPPRRGKETRGDLQRNLSAIEKMLYEALSSWRKILKPGAALVLALPVYILGNEKHGLKISEFLKLGYQVERPITPELARQVAAETAKSGNLLYGRRDQLVWREIAILRWCRPIG